MFRKTILIILLINSMALSQNIQLHYEASGDREYLVSTLEMFKPDQFGSTFWFVDMEYNDSQGIKGMSLSYWEIARSYTLPIKNLSATIQYNDGVANFGALGQVWLLGVNYYLDLGFIALPLDFLFRDAAGSRSADIQLTTTWFIPFMDGHVEFTGFVDLWSQDKPVDGKQLVLLSEPQIWYNANEHLSLGSEVEISNNFVFGADGIQILPTIGLRWTF